MTHEFSVLVQKFGGSSVAEPAKIKAVAAFIKDSLKSHEKICVVVSAMGNTTNDLISLAKNVANSPQKRELDMLISCGERSSMALLAMALIDIGVKAISLTGSQSGIITDDTHNGAEIIEIRPNRVFDAFVHHQVVIIAGFQGISLNKEITTLKRGGSDTTAVAMAAALKAKACEIYSDVPGVMDIDPNVYPDAKLLPTLRFDHMESLALYGARILALDAIRLAQKWAITLRIAQTGESELGTTITPHSHPSPQRAVLALTHLRGVIRLVIPHEKIELIENSPGYFLCGSMQDDNFIGYISNDLSQELHDKDVAVESRLALITLHLTKNEFAFLILAKIASLFKAHGIRARDLLVGRHEIFVVINDDNVNNVLSLLYPALGA